MPDGPRLLIEWSSPWQEFVTAIRPALGRSPERLAGEARTGLFPIRGMLLSWLLQALFLAALIWIPARLALLHPYVAPAIPRYHEVIYFSADELPQIQDRGGAQEGKSGRAGGQQAFHHTQTIRVARGKSVAEKVVDAPDLKLPVSTAPVKNLLAFQSIPGPPPAEGLKSSVSPPTLSKNAIVAPPPELLADLHPRTPGLRATVIAPPPSNLTRERTRQTMGLSTAVIAPAPQDVPRDQSRSVIPMTSPIIQPAPDVQHDPEPLRGPAATTATVVPPPVSAPPRDTSQTARLTLPATPVIAPPPSQVTRDRRVSGAALADPSVVPPPVQLGGRSQDKRAVPGLIGTNQVVPPPPSISPGSALSGGGSGHANKAGGIGTAVATGTVVPPPPNVSAGSTLSGAGRDPHGALGTGVIANNVVPPPPSLSGASGSLGGRGTGNKGGGIGGPFDVGTALDPPTTGVGKPGGKGVVVSAHPGSEEGLPGNGSSGVIAMSPAGASKSGAGGSGGGSGIGHGPGPGSGLNGEGSGAAKEGTGRGSDANARSGISPYPGTGGAGTGGAGQPAVPGVSVQGGGTITLPSFGPSGNDPSVPGRSPVANAHGSLDVTVEGTSRSGGAFNFYGLLKGDKVYTKYLPTAAGIVVMQFADPASAAHLYSEELTPPQAIRTDLPAGLVSSPLAIACILDRSGTLRNLQVIKAAPGVHASRILAALATWKFSPAFRGNSPVEVNALLGFNIDTRDSMRAPEPARPNSTLVGSR
jgi:hypothetical protein